MKVKITESSKKIITLATLPVAKQIIKDFVEEDEKWYADAALRIASGVNADFQILKFEAEITNNRRAYDAICDGSGNLDVHLTIYAFDSYYGFYVVGCYLSDLRQSTGDNGAEIKRHMWVSHYAREER